MRKAKNEFHDDQHINKDIIQIVQLKKKNLLSVLFFFFSSLYFNYHTCEQLQAFYTLFLLDPYIKILFNPFPFPKFYFLTDRILTNIKAAPYQGKILSVKQS